MTLLSEERKMKIVDIVENEGKVRVTHLAKYFQVSTETIRRDLEDLAIARKLKKVYGGAIKTEQSLNERSMFEREILNIDAKKVIGQKAASFIQAHDIIFVDEGSTTLQIIPHLMSLQHITIITNSFPFTVKLMEYQNQHQLKVDILFLGGQIDSKHYRTVGSLTEKMASEFYVDKAFISIDGFDAKETFTSFDLKKSLLSQTFIQNAREVYVLMDQSKVDVKANFQIDYLKNIDYIISDIKVPPHLQHLNEKWL